MSAALEIPTRLPVSSLSVSSVNLFRRCPMKWKRRYVDGDYEASSGPMLLGSAVGAAENHADQLVVDQIERPSTADVLDLYSEEFEYRKDTTEVMWGSDAPGELKDLGVLAVKAYERDVVPTYTPTSVERQFEFQPDGVEWTVRGYLDIETTDNEVADRKVIGRKMTHADAHKDPQVSNYLLARRTEGKPAAGFKFHTLVKTKTPYAEVIPTTRTDSQLDSFLDLLYQVASEILWRLENDCWGFAPPGAWWCARGQCSYFDSCPGGGLK